MFMKYLGSAVIVLTFLLPTVPQAEPGAGHVNVETVIKSEHMWNGERLPPYSEGQPEITILKVEIPPGGRLPLHLHPYANAGVLLSGELTVHSEAGLIKHLKTGDPLIELVNIPHYGANEGEVPAVVLIFYAGIQGQPVTRLLE